MQNKPTDFWAKLDQDAQGRVTGWHPLRAHSAEVAAVFEALLARTLLRQRLARTGGQEDLTPVQAARLSVLAALHDAGKVNNGFQDQAFPPVKERIGHVGPMVDVLGADPEVRNPLLMALGIDRMIGWFAAAEDAFAFLLATWGHHGKPVKPRNAVAGRWWSACARRNPAESLERLRLDVERWFPAAFSEGGEPLPAEAAFQHAYNGLLTVADWLGSDRRLFEFALDLGDPMPKARQRAAEAVEQLFLDPGRTRSVLADRPVDYSAILPGEPYPMQRAALDLPLHAGGSLVVLESDTGSGKTEAALGYFLRLFQAGLVDGIYFAVPTRSAARQLYERIHRIIGRVFPEEARPPVIQAVPGYIRADDAEPVRLPDFEVLWDDDRMPYRGWAAEHPKRYLIGPVVVGTVDQVLLSTLQVRHAHMRSAALLRHLLVVDEVHASDVYMRRLLDGVLGHHLGAGGHALLMSATLGSEVRTHLVTGGTGRTPSFEEASTEAYPLFTHVGADRQKPIRVAVAHSGFEKIVHPEPLPLAGDYGAAAALALDFARRGARVLVIRNRVADCLATQRALEDAAGDSTELLFGVQDQAAPHHPAPHHARFAPEDRLRLDRSIEAAFGKATPGRGVVAVTTQTVEQSLDIDADILITDLCPMDVLLQRIGRLHRHARTRPAGFEAARCLLLTPENRDLTAAVTQDGRGLKGRFGLGTVYPDLRVLEATWQVLEDASVGPWVIPRDNRPLVERATHPEVLERIVRTPDPRWDRHQLQRLGQELADRLEAELALIDRSLPFGEVEFPGKERRITTRLGADDVRVELPEPTPGPFGELVRSLPVRLRDVRPDDENDDLRLPKTPTAEAVSPVPGGFEFSYAGSRFRYTRMGMEKI